MHSRSLPVLALLLAVGLVGVPAATPLSEAEAEAEAAAKPAGAPTAKSPPPAARRAAPAPARSRTGSGCARGTVSLTFDDGPGWPTRRLVRVLREQRAPATFFMVGRRVVAQQRVARYVERSGFLVANHSWSHADMTRQSYRDVVATLRATDRALRAAGTRPTPLMRPPYGAINPRVRRAVRAAGLVPVLWTADSRDWTGGTAEVIARRIVRQLRPGANIVLQHDAVTRSPTSISAVPSVIRQARRLGYCFVALDEAGRPGFPTPQADLTATSGAEGERVLAAVHLAGPAGRDVSVRLRTVSGTARGGRDFTPRDQRIRIPAGRSSVHVPIRLLHDAVSERVEEFQVVIDRPFGVSLGTRSVTVRISDADQVAEKRRFGAWVPGLRWS